MVTDFFGSVRNVELLNKTSAESDREEEETPAGNKEETSAEREKGGGIKTVFPSGHYLTPQDSLVRILTHILSYMQSINVYVLLMQPLPLKDSGTKVSDDDRLVHIAVVLFMTILTMATTLGIYHVIAEH